jgi:hypothetical protein
MNPLEAKQILVDTNLRVTEVSVFGSGADTYVDLDCSGNLLEGNFTPDQLEALVTWLRHPQRVTQAKDPVSTLGHLTDALESTARALREVDQPEFLDRWSGTPMLNALMVGVETVVHLAETLVGDDQPVPKSALVRYKKRMREVNQLAQVYAKGVQGLIDQVRAFKERLG